MTTEKKSGSRLVNIQHEHNEETEFYPSTQEIVDKFSDWSNRNVYTEDGKIFCNLKLYKNGNRHIKFCKEFMQKLNVEMARINGWIHSKEEAKEEFGLSETEINQYWNYNLKIGIGEGRNLLGLPDAMGA